MMSRSEEPTAHPSSSPLLATHLLAVFLYFILEKSHFLFNFSAWAGFPKALAQPTQAASFLNPCEGTTPSFPALIQHHP